MMREAAVNIGKRTKRSHLRTGVGQTAMLRFRSLRIGFVIFCSVLVWTSASSPIVFASPIGSSVTGNEIKVSNLQELNSAISSAKPGDVIIMTNGAWHNTVIDFTSKATSSAPVTLRAETPGNVILDGNSKLTFSRPNLVVDGLFFTHGAIESGSVINFNSDECRLTNTAVADYNPAQFETAYYWVYFRGNSNRLDHCYLKGKNNMNPLIGNDEKNSRHNTVDHCHIKDIAYVPDNNGREVMRIWGYGHGDEMGEDGAYFTVEYNLFERAHGEGVEIVSLKSNYNMVRYNTVRASRGGLVGRRGKNNTFEGNFILGAHQEGTTGIRVAGQNHRVVNNYISDVAEDGLRLITGEYYEKSLTAGLKPKKKDLPKYVQVRDGYFAHNTIVNVGGNGIDIGYNYKNQWPGVQMVLLPENNRFVNNLVYHCGNKAITMAAQDKNPPLDFLAFAPNHFEGNIAFGGAVDLVPVPSGIENVDPQLVLRDDGVYGLSKGSPARRAGVRSDVREDMDGQLRGEKKDIGADELSETKPVRHPLKPNEVGPPWVVKKRIAGENF
jgi:poly(beta-D-mannuronate) lyase